MDKKLELKHRIEGMEKAPHIIALQEVKLKKYRYDRTTTEYTLEGYEITERNLNEREDW